MIDEFLTALRADRRPLLTRAQEVGLGRRIQQGGRRGEHAHREMVERNLRLAVSVAKKHRNRGLPFEDLIQVAALGVMRAAEKFDPERDLKFSTYCIWWCRAEIDSALRNTARGVRLSGPVYSDLRRVRAIERELLTRSSDAVTPEAIAAETGPDTELVLFGARSAHNPLSAARVAEVLAFGRDPLSLNMSFGRIDITHESGSELGDVLPDEAASTFDQVAATLRDEALGRALRDLPYRQRRVVVMRHGLAGEEPRTLDHVAAIFKVQREQVRVLQQRAELQLAEVLS